MTRPLRFALRWAHVAVLAALGVYLVVLPVLGLYTPRTELTIAGANYLNLLAVYLLLTAMRRQAEYMRDMKAFMREVRERLGLW